MAWETDTLPRLRYKDCCFVALSELDFERRGVYSYRVVATDAGQPRRSADSRLDVQVIDVDDEFPRFDVAEYHFRIAENLPVGTAVGRVEAVDRDSSPEFRRISYSDDGHNISKFLTLDSVTGEIRTAAVLDRELVSSLTLRVFAAPAAARDRPEVTSSSHCDVIVGLSLIHI